ncbi:MAG: phenylalanine--tRNA ligase subunit beta [Alphaproteobacteria bacterium]|nr:phenylalanine--tRNA ligase subunit beta [Alphaproteobacteria bacterium]
MKFTFDWLKDHLKTELSYDEIAEKLTNLGIEVEGIVDNRKKFDGFVVGFIEAAEKHPDADRLQVCRVSVGSSKLQIVCGAKNARAGIFVAVALPGALIPASGEYLKKGMIRGVESQGMMCSTDELALSDDGIDGIMELPDTVVVGEELASALRMDDVIFDVSLTPNRGDCFSVRGIARDLAAAGAGELLDLPHINVAEDIENPIEVDIQTAECDYFSTLAMKNVSGKTPDYIARRLSAIGQNLIYMPVDIANYVCFDIGQPLHMFDLDKIPNKLVVRNSKAGETLEAFGGKTLHIPEEAVIVAAEDAPLSVAGIMGGVESGVSENSRDILIECAYYDKVAIAKAGQKLKLTSDARTRFERGVDPASLDFAIRYAAALISKSCEQGVCQASGIRKYGTPPSNVNDVELTSQKFMALTGLSREDFSNSPSLLEKLGIRVRSVNADKILLKTPSWRHDLVIEEDIIEEIVRLVGYDDIPEVHLSHGMPDSREYVSSKISDALVYSGFFEVKTFSFTDRRTAALFAPNSELVKVKEASTTEFSTLRPTIVVSHLQSVKNLQNKSQMDSRMFEIGKCFCRENCEIKERNTLVLTMAGNRTARNWRQKQSTFSVFDAKEIVEKILNMLGINFRMRLESPVYYHPGRSGTYIFQKETKIAQFGEIHPSVLSTLGISGSIVCAEVFLDEVPEFFEHRAQKPLVISPYQPVMRDFSFVMKKTVSATDVQNAIKKLRISEIRNFSIFDVYESASLGEENKALAFELTLQSDDGTLSEQQISNISQKVIIAVSKDCSATLRE